MTKRGWRQLARDEFRLQVELFLRDARTLSRWIEPAVGHVSVEVAMTAWKEQVREFLALHQKD